MPRKYRWLTEGQTYRCSHCRRWHLASAAPADSSGKRQRRMVDV